MATSADHGARDHAQWSASATARNWHCPGALALSAGIAQGPESIHAARGTAAHQISEKSLRTGNAPVVYLGTTEKTKEHQIAIDDELVASATAYVEYVWGRHQAGVAAAMTPGVILGVAPIEAVTLQIEQRFSLAKLDPPFEAGGTADAVLYFAADRLLEVVDLKNGMGIVDATENPQLRTYALGALLANPGLDVARVRVTIVQPRAPLRGETIRSDEFSAAELIEWTWDLLAAMQRSARAFAEFEGDSLKLDTERWNAEWLRPGKCKFCPAEATCPALRNRGVDAMNKAAAWFEAPATAGNDEAAELAADLDRFALVEDWIKARRARAHQLAEQGVEIPGHRLVESYGHRKWKENTERDLGMVAIREGIDFTEDFYDRKLKSPAAVEKLLGAKRKHLIADLIEKPVTGKTLVRADKTDRPAVPGRAATYFEPQE